MEGVDRHVLLEVAGRHYRREGVREQTVSDALGLTPAAREPAD